MAVYLSTGMLGELSRRLIAGGYRADTPAALVYKATWPEEEAYVCTVGQLEQTAKEHNITKTALILVGEVVSHRQYEKSRLYAAISGQSSAKLSHRRMREPQNEYWHHYFYRPGHLTCRKNKRCMEKRTKTERNVGKFKSRRGAERNPLPVRTE